MNDEGYDQYRYSKALQDDQVDSQKAMYAPTMKEQLSQAQAVVITQTNPKEVLKEIEYALRNIELDADTNQIRRLGNPLMNNRGINQMKSIARSIVNQNTILSRLENTQEVNRITLHLANNVVDDLALNWQGYEINNLADLDVIADSVIFPMHMALKRALEESEKKFLGRISFESINKGGADISKPKSKWSDMFKI